MVNSAVTTKAAGTVHAVCLVGVWLRN